MLPSAKQAAAVAALSLISLQHSVRLPVQARMAAQVYQTPLLRFRISKVPADLAAVAALTAARAAQVASVLAAAVAARVRLRVVTAAQAATA